MDTQYKKTCDDIVSNGYVQPGDVYDFVLDKELELLYAGFWHMANTHLQEKANLLGFPSSYLFFKQDYSVNAFARPRPEYMLIGIHYGAFDIMHAFFEGQKTVLQSTDFPNIQSLADRIGCPAYILFFKYFSVYLYFHEYAHLVQFSDTNGAEIDETQRKNIPADQVMYYHAHELDADWLAASNMAIYMAGFFQDEEGKFVGKKEDLADLMSIAAAAMVCYFIKAAGYFPDIYFKEENHPHPYIRISYIMEFFMRAFSVNLPVDVVLDLKEITKKGVKLAEQMLKSEMGNPVLDFAATFMAYDAQIETYIKDIMEYGESLPGLCNNRNGTPF